jgi:hypothetical protein
MPGLAPGVFVVAAPLAPCGAADRIFTSGDVSLAGIAGKRNEEMLDKAVAGLASLPPPER